MIARDRQRASIAFSVALALAAAAGDAAAQAAQAAQRKIALVAPGAALERAARTALEPWNVQIVVAGGAPPGATAPRNSAAARELALLHGVAAVVWVSEHEQGHAIWVYDVDTDQLLARPLSGALPFDDPTAAAVALSVKTLLRHSATAPAAERYGAATTAAVAPSRALPAAAEPQRKSPIADAAEDADDTEAAAAQARSLLDFEALAGLRFGLTRPSATEGRFAVGVLVFPAAGALGFGLRAALGPELRFESADFDGELLDAAPGLVGRFRLPLTALVAVAAGAGATAHVTVFDGSVSGAGADPGPIESVVRLVPSLDLELLGDVRLGPLLRLGARAGVVFWLRPQRYRVGPQTVLELSRAAFEAGLSLTAGLPN